MYTRQRDLMHDNMAEFSPRGFIRTKASGTKITYLYSIAEIDAMVVAGYIPVASGAEMNALKTTSAQTMGLGTRWEGTYTTGVDKNYIQVADCSLIAYANWTPISTFTGIFDGNNQNITNLTISSSAAGTNYLGLFGVNNGTVRNVNIISCSIQHIGTSITIYTGGICGSNGSTGLIEWCNVSGYVRGVAYIGGFVGWNNGGIIKYSRCSCNISSANAYSGGFVGVNQSGGIIEYCVATGNADNTVVSTSTAHVGGFCGYNLSATIRYCASFGYVNTAARYAGGFVSLNGISALVQDCYSLGASTATNLNPGGFCSLNQTASQILRCYSTGLVTGATSGGFCAANSATISNCYWDTVTSGQAASSGGTGKTTTELKQGVPGASIYTTWLNSIWQFYRPTYAYLKVINKLWQPL